MLFDDFLFTIEIWNAHLYFLAAAVAMQCIPKFLLSSVSVRCSEPSAFSKEKKLTAIFACLLPTDTY